MTTKDIPKYLTMREMQHTRPRRGKDGSKTKITRLLLSDQWRDDDFGKAADRLFRSAWWRDTLDQHRPPGWRTPLVPSRWLHQGDHRENCTWQLIVTNGTLSATLHDPDGRPYRSPQREIDFYHAMAHVITPNAVALHGTEFVMNLLFLIEKFKFTGMTKPESKRFAKNILRGANVKTSVRSPEAKAAMAEKKRIKMIRELQEMAEGFAPDPE